MFLSGFTNGVRLRRSPADKAGFLFIYNAVFSASNGEIRFTLHEIRIMLAFRTELAENNKPAKNLCDLCDLCGQKSQKSA